LNLSNKIYLIYFKRSKKYVSNKRYFYIHRKLTIDEFDMSIVDTADDPCIETYGGPSAMSENETQAVTSFILAHNDTIKGTITLHSYGQLFLTRWAYSNDVHAPEYNQTVGL